MSDVSPPLPSFTSWPTFPFEGDIRVKKLDDPVDDEPPRQGEDPAECTACRAPDSGYIWVSERWRVRALDRPTGLPMVLILESRSHLDLGDLPNLLAAELGVLTVRLERAIRSLDGVARVHVNRWGDGSAHLHVWFLARPVGRLQLRGTFLSLWDDILPRIPEDQWRADLALVAEWLAEFGGTALAESPRIDWQAPALLNLPPEAAGLPDDEAIADTAAEAGDAKSGEAETRTAQHGEAGPTAGPDAESAEATEGVANGEPDGVAVWEEETESGSTETGRATAVASAPSGTRAGGATAVPGPRVANDEDAVSRTPAVRPSDRKGAKPVLPRNRGNRPGAAPRMAATPGGAETAAETAAVAGAATDVVTDVVTEPADPPTPEAKPAARLG